MAGPDLPSERPTDEVPSPTDRLWLELSDEGDQPDTVHRFDLTWLTSSYRCIFGAGCPGIDASVPDAGCCVHGAYFSEPDDEARVAQAVARLDPSTWANHDHPEHGAGAEWAEADEDGDRRTARVAGACVFHNPRDFAGGYGCALHALALAEDVPPLSTKPDVCWQLPLRRTYDTVERPDGSQYLQVTVTEYTRGGWGGGGADFDWYCSSSPSAHVAPEPVWLSLRDELVELVGEDVYERLAVHCEQLRPARGRRRLLPLTVHPATAAAASATGGARLTRPGSASD
ncbi:hypothetical protein [Jannaschia sp. R86511]|uniref:hypothetical protein n=1 Tax=Jannaschia sp. R86511 TaxID=3093853 RepID=UPI0036D2EB45